VDIAETPFSLSALYKDIKYMLKFAAGNRRLSCHVHMATDIEGDLEFPGKGVQLRIVMAMLMANSIKSTEGGYVKLSILKESETATSTIVKFILEDTSRRPGGETHSSTLLELWPSHTGRTLSIVKSFIESASGRMVLDSSPGLGTTITLWLPFAKPATRHPTRWSPSTLAPDTSLSPVSGSPTISLNLSPRGQPLNMFNPEELLPTSRRSSLLVLVASANLVAQQFTTSYLKTAGFQTTTVRTVPKALSYLTAAMRNEQPKPALLLLDDQTPKPEPSGTERASILRTRQPYRDFLRDVPIIALTAAADPPVPPAATTTPNTTGSRIKDDKRGSCLGEMCFVDDYLPKPVTRDALERMVVWWIVKGREELEELSRGGIRDRGLVPERGLSESQHQEEALLDEAAVEMLVGPVNRCVLQ
jgi:CheY-like chemotaxis protein